MTSSTVLTAALGFGLSMSVGASPSGQAPARTAPAPQTAAAPHGSVERIKVHGKALEGNLEGDSPDRDVSIYLPPSYRTATNRRYPVVYLCIGM